MYITLDPFYTVTEYNRFLESLKNNGVKYSQWISTRAPYNWYLKIDDDDYPRFIDFEVLNKAHERYLVSVIVPQRSQDNYLLLRRDTDNPTKQDKFILNDAWKRAHKAKHLIIFRYESQEQLANLSKKYGIRIYVMGRHRWRMAMAYSQYLEGEITKEMTLFSKSKKQLREFRNPGDIEAEFNYRILRTSKIENKTLKTTYWENGQKYPAVTHTI